jgi:hypothetical protein
MPVSVVQEFERADAVFAGRVVEMTTDSVAGAAELRGYIVVTFDVSQVWQGDVDSTARVRTGSGGANCGYGFARGQDYLVYATQVEADLVTSLCTLNKPLADASADIAAFQSGPPRSPAWTIDPVSRGWLIVVAVSVALALGRRRIARWRRQ